MFRMTTHGTGAAFLAHGLDRPSGSFLLSPLNARFRTQRFSSSSSCASTSSSSNPPPAPQWGSPMQSSPLATLRSSRCNSLMGSSFPHRLPPHLSMAPPHAYPADTSGNDETLARIQHVDMADLDAADAGEENPARETGSTMRPLDQAASALVGPLSLFMVGFSREEIETWRRHMIEDLEADMVPILSCTDDVFKSATLRQALAQPPGLPFSPMHPSTPRTIFLSGMYPSEVMDVVQTYHESGLPDAVFAAAVENNLDRLVGDLVREVHADQAAAMGMTTPAGAGEEEEEEEDEQEEGRGMGDKGAGWGALGKGLGLGGGGLPSDLPPSPLPGGLGKLKNLFKL